VLGGRIGSGGQRGASAFQLGWDVARGHNVEVADLDDAVGQDVLEESADEFRWRPCGGVRAAGVEEDDGRCEVVTVRVTTRTDVTAYHCCNNSECCTKEEIEPTTLVISTIAPLTTDTTFRENPCLGYDAGAHSEDGGVPDTSVVDGGRSIAPSTDLGCLRAVSTDGTFAPSFGQFRLPSPPPVRPVSGR